MMVPVKSAGMASEYARSNTERTFIFVNKRPGNLFIRIFRFKDINFNIQLFSIDLKLGLKNEKKLHTSILFEFLSSFLMNNILCS